MQITVPARDQRRRGHALSRGRQLGLVSMASLAVAGLLASPAGAYVYYGRSGGTQIERANLDGTSIQQNFIVGVNSPTGIAVDSAHIYWVNHGANTIGRANLDGTSVQQNFITGASGPTSVTVDASHIYWANLAGGSIGRADISGSPASVNQTFIPAPSATGVAVDAGHIYWSDRNGQAIYRANIDGTNLARYIDTSYPNGDPGYAQAVSVNATYVYWTTANGSQDGVISRATLGDPAGAPEHLVTGPPTDGTILRANLDGTSPIKLISESSTVSYVGADGVAVDALGPNGNALPAGTPPSAGAPPAGGSAPGSGSAPAGTGPPVPSGPSVGASDAGAVVAGQASVSGTSVSLPLSCQALTGTICAATMQLTVTESFKGSSLVAVSAAQSKRSRNRRRVLSLGYVSAALQAGQSRVIRISLNRAGRRLLSLRHKLPASLVVTQAVGGTSAVVRRQKVTFKANSRTRKPARR